MEQSRVSFSRHQPLFQRINREYLERILKLLQKGTHRQSQQGMAHVICDHQIRETLRLRSLERAAYFSWEKCADETYATLTDWP